MKKVLTLFALWVFILLMLPALLYAQPGNDNCSGAILLPLGTSCDPLQVDFSGATNGPDECSDDGIWFRVVVPPSGSVFFSTLSPGTNDDTEIKAYRGSCGNLTLLSDDCQDEDNTNFNSHEQISLSGLTPGENLYFVVDDRGDGGTVSVCAVVPLPPVTNDDCVNAIELPVGSDCSPVLASFNGATNGPDECDDHGVWFRATVPASGNIFFSTFPGLNFDTEIKVYSGSCGNFTLLSDDCQDNDNGESNHEIISLTGRTPGETLYLVVDDRGDGGSFSVCAQEVSISTPSDGCANATPLTVGNTCDPTTFTFQGATNGADECADNGVWFQAIVPASGNIAFTTLSPGTNDDTEIKVYSGSCGNFTLLSDDCQDDDNTENGLESITLTGLTPGETLYLIVDDRGDGGSFSVCAQEVSISTPSDDCANATPLPVGLSPIPTLYTFSEATTGPDECSGDRGVWFQAVVPTSGSFVFRTLPVSPFLTLEDTELRVYQGDCNNLVELTNGCQDEDNTPNDNHEQIGFVNLTPGETLYLVVSELGDGGPLFGLTAFNPFAASASITDPCNCISGIDLDSDGNNDLAQETITITAVSGQTVTLTSAGGLLDGANNPASGTATDNNDGTYTFVGYIPADGASTYTAEFTISGGGPNDGEMLFVSGGPCSACLLVPTMSEWSFFLFALILLNLMLVGVWNVFHLRKGEGI